MPTVPLKPIRRSAQTRIVHSSPDWDKALGPNWPDWVMDIDETNRKHAKQGRSIVRWAVSPSLTV